MVEVFDGRAYVLTWLGAEHSRLAIHDLSGDRLGRLVGRTDAIRGFAVDVVVYDDFAYVSVVDDWLSSGAMEIIVIDLREPAIPHPAARFVVASETPHLAGITLAGGFLYVAAGAEGLKVFDLSNPAAPHLVGAHPDPVVGVLPHLGGLVVWRDLEPLDFAPVVELHQMSLADPTHPIPVGPGRPLDGQPSAMVSDGPSLHVSLFDGTAYRFEIDEAGVFRETSSLSVDGRIFDLALQNGVLAVVVAPDGEDNTVRFYDAGSSSRRLPKLATVSPEASAYDVAWAGDRLLIGAADGLYVYDAIESARPARLVGPEVTRAWARRLAIHGTTAYVADTFRGLVTVDLSNPTRPRELAAVGEPAEGVAEHDGRAYAVGKMSLEAVLGVEGGASLQVFDVSEPAHPVALGGLPAAWAFADDAVMAGGDLYVDAGYEMGGMVRVDVSDPRAPFVAESPDIEGTVVDMTSEGDVLAVATDMRELHLLDVSGPWPPRLVTRFSGEGWRLALQGDLLAAGIDFLGVEVFDWVEPETARRVASYGPLYDVLALALDDGRLATADAAGLRLVDLDPGGCSRELTVLPLPARVTDLAFMGEFVVVVHGDGLLVVRTVIGEPVEVVGRLRWAG